MQVKPGLHRVQSSNQVVYALECDGVYALVDVGDEAELGNKLEALRADGIEPDRIAAVLITHFHDDHCGGLVALRRACRPQVIAHRLSVEQTTMMPPMDRSLVDHTVDDGDTVQIGHRRFTVHHLPGHTHDSVVYQLEQDLFIGDITFEWAGVGWMDIHWGSCIWQYRESLNRLLAMAPATLYPGHGGPCVLSQASIFKALNTLDILEKMDGSPLVIGQPARTRGTDERRQNVVVQP